MVEKEIDAPTGVETTGHEWDGIKELNNPLPRWWLIVLWASVIWSIGYWVFMPSWPGVTGYAKGLRGHSERANVERALIAFDAERNAQLGQLVTVETIADIEKNPDLFQYSMNAGASLFGDNCATCHGAGGQGGVGYPNLLDDDWLWGGALGDIRHTIRFGIRSGHADARTNIMQAFGRDGILTRDQISELVDYVVTLSGREATSEASARGAATFARLCVACHGADGRGSQPLGAPNLTDNIWLYGADRTAIFETLYRGRGGVMPAWNERLSDGEVTALAVYVHSLGGGE